ncbi:alanine--glyoxylate aminotransferase-like [Cylas formicarius]|uniref:alanine--glyoxylate aminotransferase-like n=1 Tax=Cylas formicarius TaxID=197179 RepID=UPI0029585231|nr:alanine--glyoxylate aminotransferase-like [Cylas formicarius]
MDVAPPQELFNPLRVPNKILMGPGPSNPAPRVLRAIAQPVIGHMHPETFQVMDEIKKGIQYVFQTRNEVTLCISASGHGGMEALVCNLIEPGDKILITANGLWGNRIADLATRYGGVVKKLTSKLSRNFSLGEIEHAIESFRPKVLFTIQGESTTGVYQPLEGIGDICKRYQCLFAVDTVASLGAVPVFVDRWKIDAIYSGSQKILGAPPGLAPVSFSSAAVSKILHRKTIVPVYYWDIILLAQQWDCFPGKSRIYHHTVSSNLLCAFREGLAIIAQEGIENVIARHQRCASQLYRGLEKLKLEFFVEEEHDRLPSVTTLKVPTDVDWNTVLDYIMEKYQLEVGGGLGPTVGQVFRIGLMGYNATPEKVEFVLSALREALAYARTKPSKL